MSSEVLRRSPGFQQGRVEKNTLSYPANFLKEKRYIRGDESLKTKCRATILRNEGIIGYLFLVQWFLDTSETVRIFYFLLFGHHWCILQKNIWVQQEKFHHIR